MKGTMFEKYDCYMIGVKNGAMWDEKTAYVIFNDKKLADAFVEKNYPDKFCQLSGLHRTRHQWFDILSNRDNVTFL